jgi:RNA-binding protein NOB1
MDIGFFFVVRVIFSSYSHKRVLLTILKHTSSLYSYLLRAEVEGCNGDKTHIRTTPKRTLGVGHIQSLAPEEQKDAANTNDGNGNGGNEEAAAENKEKNAEGASFFEGEAMPPPEMEAEQPKMGDTIAGAPVTSSQGTAPAAPKSWAMLVNPSSAAALPAVSAGATDGPKSVALKVQFAPDTEEDAGIGGQFDDAEEEDDEDDSSSSDDDDDDDGERYANISDPDDFSDEECDVYILDPEEVEERKRRKEEQNATRSNNTEDAAADLADQLAEAFPSLAAAATVPYDGSDDEGEGDAAGGKSALQLAQEDAERKRQESLKPIAATRDGKLYNSFRKYGHVVASEGIKKKSCGLKGEPNVDEADSNVSAEDGEKVDAGAKPQTDRRKDQSRILGGDMSMAGKMAAEDDDGEGWITTTSDIQSMKAAGRLDPTRDPAKEKDGGANAPKGPIGPPLSQRTACATTDFAMQNVILQMNLSLVTVDGVKVRRLKSWVTRCGACFTVYTGDQNGLGTTRLFCERCGSDFMQRIAASVDGKTGRLKLHLSKKYKTSTRGTKFSLPAPGKGNRFEGDLLLREDQLMTGVWNQKAKKARGKKEAQSIFGSDIASNVGCHADLTKSDNIRVGFGRRNPNAAKGGRERRGKKKKGTEVKACGLRRY